MFVDIWLLVPPRLHHDADVEDLIYDRGVQFDVIADHVESLDQPGRTFKTLTTGGQ